MYSLFPPHSPFSLGGKWAVRDFVKAILRNGKERNVIQKSHFTEKIALEMYQFFGGGNKCDLFRKIICTLSNHIYWNNQ